MFGELLIVFDRITETYTISFDNKDNERELPQSIVQHGEKYHFRMSVDSALSTIQVWILEVRVVVIVCLFEYSGDEADAVEKEKL